MKEKYIYEKLKALEEEQKKVTKKSNIIDIATHAGSVLFGTMAIIGVFSLPSLAVTSGIVSLLNLYHNYKNEKITKEKQARITQEMNHLKAIRAQVPKFTPGLEKKRKQKVEELNKDFEGAKSASNRSGILSKLSTAATTVGSFLAFSNPALLLLPIGGIALSVFSGQLQMANIKNRENLRNRIDNIENDRTVIIKDQTDQLQKKRATVPTQPKATAPVRTKQGTSQPPKKRGNSNSRALGNTNEEMVNRYIHQLENQKREEKGMQKVKK